MDDFFYMLLLAALAIPVIAIAALVVALSQFSAVRRLDERLRALEFARAVVRHACTVCGWDPGLSASVEGVPPPVV